MPKGPKHPVPFRLRPIVYVFPTTDGDGNPFVKGLDQKIELRTTVGSHPVELTFNLSHFQTTELAALSLSEVD